MILRQFRFTRDKQNSSKCGKKCQNLQEILSNNLDAAKFQLLASKDRTGMTIRFQSTVRTEFGTDYELRLAELYQTVQLLDRRYDSRNLERLK